MLRLVTALAAATLLLTASHANAAFPGENGRIVFQSTRDDPNPAACDPCNYEIYSMDASGNDLNRLTTDTGFDLHPAWSPDGMRLAFAARRPGDASIRIYLMNPDGTGQVGLTGNNEHPDVEPAWSPSGDRLTFTSENVDVIYSVGSDGSGEGRLIDGFVADQARTDWSPNGAEIVYDDYFTNDVLDSFRHLFAYSTDGSSGRHITQCGNCHESGGSWSPDGKKIAFTRHFSLTSSDIAVMNPDGTGVTSLTDASARNDRPAWSPDGSKIAFASNRDGNYEIYLMNADGSDETRITNDPADDREPDWQPIIRGYPRPQGARSLRVPLAIAYDECPPPGNRTHGPALSFPSCSPATQSSSQLTVGTIDANGQSPKFNGSVRYFVQPGVPGGADDADVELDLLATDVRLKSDLSDYSGELEARVTIRITDRQNQPSPPSGGHGTVTDLPFSFTAPCSATPTDETVGSTCQVSTSADSVVPGAAVEGKRALWELGQVRVYDGIGDLFATQGIFIP